MKKTGRKKMLPENRTVTLTISIQPEQLQRFVAHIRNRNKSQFTREAIEEKMAREIPKQL